IKLKVGEKVNFHMHVGECELYYIISGKAIYNDNGEKVTLEVGDVTYTPSDEGHGIENAGDTPLEFIALIVKD
ncbi:MAG: cupin domain-containing protein, partial [Clostridia bacterium]|nr:cupin domain-containing protein [Clostridia bacterium]